MNATEMGGSENPHCLEITRQARRPGGVRKIAGQ
jgi:hypothetical protein